MTDTTLLDGSVDDVKAGLTGLNASALVALLAAETAGKTRKGVLDAIKFAQAALPTDDSGDAPIADAGLQSEAQSLAVPANIAPATSFDPAGAPDQVVDFDIRHPAVDADPRANTTELQNRIDFNDPTREGIDVVTERTQAASAN